MISFSSIASVTSTKCFLRMPKQLREFSMSHSPSEMISPCVEFRTTRRKVTLQSSSKPTSESPLPSKQPSLNRGKLWNARSRKSSRPLLLMTFLFSMIPATIISLLFSLVAPPRNLALGLPAPITPPENLQSPNSLTNNNSKTN